MQKLSDNSARRLAFIGLGLLLMATAYAAGSHARGNGAATGTQLSRAEKTLADGHGKLALQMFTPLADKGSAEADYWIADIYGQGVGVPADQAKAIGYLTQAANQGYGPAEVRLGEIYLRGEKTLQDFDQAQGWLSKAALQGDAEAARDLGGLFEKGLGVQRDPVTAYAWYETAVRQGDYAAGPLRDRVVAALNPTALSQAEAKAQTLTTRITQTG